MRLVATENIQKDMTLARNIYKLGCIYLKKGEHDLYKYSKRLKELGVDYVYVYDDDSDGIAIDEIVSEETVNRCEDALRDTFTRIENNSSVDFGVFASPVQDLINSVMFNTDVQINLTDISTMDAYTLGHSVSTAIYATLIGIDRGYSKKTLQDLATGALLHDIGKIRLDPHILFKEGRLTDEEFEHVRKHPEYSYQILKFCKNLTSPAKLIALNHHERLDGTGYPRKLKGRQINEFSRIVAVADVYDALSTNRCYRRKWPTNKIVDFLVQHSGTQFDPEILGSLIKKIAIYPNGSEVKLSDGTYALVFAQNPSAPQRPIVKVIKDSNGLSIEPYFIDMMKELSIVITASQLELEYKETGEEYESIL